MMRDIDGTTRTPPGTSVSDHAVLYRIFEEVAKTGLPLFVHPHDQALYALFVQRAQAQWGIDFRSYARALRGGDGVAAEHRHLAPAGVPALHRRAAARPPPVDARRRPDGAGGQGPRADVTAEANPFAMFVTNDWSNIERLGLRAGLLGAGE